MRGTLDTSQAIPRSMSLEFDQKFGRQVWAVTVIGMAVASLRPSASRVRPQSQRSASHLMMALAGRSALAGMRGLSARAES